MGLLPQDKVARAWPDDLSPSSAEVKDGLGHTSTLSYAYIRWCLVTPRDDFTLMSVILQPLFRKTNPPSWDHK